MSLSPMPYDDEVNHPSHPNWKKTGGTCWHRLAWNNPTYLLLDLPDWIAGRSTGRMDEWRISPCTGHHEMLLRIRTLGPGASAAHIIKESGGRYDLYWCDPTALDGQCVKIMPRFPAGLTQDQAEEVAAGKGLLSAVLMAEEILGCKTRD